MVRALFIRLAPFISATLDIAECEYLELVQSMQQEWEDHHTTLRYIIAFGQKAS